MEKPNKVFKAGKIQASVFVNKRTKNGKTVKTEVPFGECIGI